MLLGIQPSSHLASLSLSKRTCPLGLLVVLGSADKQGRGWVYNEEVSGDIFVRHPELPSAAAVILLSAHAGNIGRCLELATWAAGAGKRVIIGGPEPSMIGPRLLRDHPYLDAIVVGPGDGSIGNVLAGGSDTGGGGAGRARVFRRGDVGDCSPLDYTPPFRSIDFRNARVDYSLLWDFEKHEGLSYLWGNDCAQARKRCFFCGRLAMGVGYRPPERVWSELLWAYRRGMRWFYNTTDSVTTNMVTFREFCEAKPAEMTDDTHRVFVNSRDVNPELIVALRRLCGTAVIGIESFGNLAAAGKVRTSDDDNLRSVKMLYAAGVPMVLSFVFGLPGETPETIEANERGIEQMVSLFGDQIEAIHLSPLLITTGSPAFRQLMSHADVRARYESRSVPYDIIEMSNDYFARYCSVSRQFCIHRAFALAARIQAVAPHISTTARLALLAGREAGAAATNCPRGGAGDTTGRRGCGVGDN